MNVPVGHGRRASGRIRLLRAAVLAAAGIAAPYVPAAEGSPGRIPIPAAESVQDADTLLLLPFDRPLDPLEYFVKGRVSFVRGRFGKSLRQGAGAYVATSAEEYLDARQGTIEAWVKFLTPGDDRVSRAVLHVPGPRGLWLGKDQYGHVSFRISRNWGTGTRVWADGHARGWEPGVWRHFVACWDQNNVRLWVDGRLLGSEEAENMPEALGPELRIGSPGVVLDDLRLSRVARYGGQ